MTPQVGCSKHKRKQTFTYRRMIVQFGHSFGNCSCNSFTHRTGRALQLRGASRSRVWTCGGEGCSGEHSTVPASDAAACLLFGPPALPSSWKQIGRPSTLVIQQDSPDLQRRCTQAFRFLTHYIETLGNSFYVFICFVDRLLRLTDTSTTSKTARRQAFCCHVVKQRRSEHNIKSSRSSSRMPEDRLDQACRWKKL